MTPPLRHGEWKLRPNHVLRQDGTLLQYTPPEHVQSEMERLVELYSETTSDHPVVRAAWLHHRFIAIHPFEDGNGRVGRALVLLVLLRSNYAPLVVAGRRRSDYIAALDAANEADLSALVRLFAQLEIVALRSELERPAEAAMVGAGAIDLARSFAERLRAKRDRSDEERATAVAALAVAVQGRLEDHLEQLGEGLREAFLSADPDTHVGISKATPPQEEARFWGVQLIRSAKAAEFYTNLAEGSWWVRLRLVVLGQHLRYVVAVQKVGHGETGVLAVTTFAELVPPREGEGHEPSLPTPLLTTTSADSVTLVHTDAVDSRWLEVRDLVESTLAAAVAEFGRRLG